MKFSVFHPFPNYGVPESTWPNPPRLSRVPGLARDGIDKAITFALRAEAVGVDQVSVAEHHYSAKQLSPNSAIGAVLVAQATTTVGVGLLGSTLPLVNPLRLAEEIGMLDAIAGGRLMVGFFRGTPNEYLTYGSNPWESKEVFQEQVELLQAAWREPEPFAWVGRHFDYRTVSVWPQPSEEIPILVAANSPASAEYAARKGFIAGFAFAPPPVIASFASVYRETSAALGREIGPDDMLYRAFGLIADTDEEAERLQERTQYGNFGNLDRAMGGAAPASARVAAAMKGVPADAPIPEGLRPPAMGRPLFMGSPETVARQIAAFVETTGVGRIELVLSDAELPFADAMRSLDLFGTEVIPRVRELVDVAVAS